MIAKHIVAEQNFGRSLKQADLDWFVKQGVPALALARSRIGAFGFLRVDDVVFLEGGCFEFRRHLSSGNPEPAYTLTARDVCGDIVDIVAWQPVTGRLASWVGRAAMLGTENLYGPRLNEGLLVHDDLLAWLRSFRDGVVVVNEKRAAWWLRSAEPLVVSSIESGRYLKQILSQPAPRILVSAAEGIAA
jgi:hypothetical protein